jgi:hypothetical protein
MTGCLCKDNLSLLGRLASADEAVDTRFMAGCVGVKEGERCAVMVD